jgi:hypothetical protein
MTPNGNHGRNMSDSIYPILPSTLGGWRSSLFHAEKATLVFLGTMLVFVFPETERIEQQTNTMVSQTCHNASFARD